MEHHTAPLAAAKISLSLAQYIDHTLLKPDATRPEIERVCNEAKSFGCVAVCVNGCWVPIAREILRESAVNVCTVVGFPLGASSTASKIAEAIDALENGAREIDMVMNIGWLKARDDTSICSEIKSLASICHDHAAILKVIIETGLLSETEKERACALIEVGEADFIKTCTGFAEGGASVADVQLFKRCLGDRIRIKASKGIRDRATAEALITAGASRLGTSATAAILQGGAGGVIY